jgi:hypothetical protein
LRCWSGRDPQWQSHARNDAPRWPLPVSTRVKRAWTAGCRRESENPMSHKFKIGQTVDLESNILRSLAPASYVIRHLIPASDRNPGDPCYRIRSIAEKYERAAPESELTLSVAAAS